MSNLTIGQFNDSFKPVMDGVGMCAENYARWIQEKHGQAVVVTPRVPDFQDTDPFPVLRFPSVGFPPMRPYRLGLPPLGLRFQRRLRALPFDLVHSHCPFVSGLLARRVARRRGIPHITTFHTKYREDVQRVVSNQRLADAVVRRIVRFYQSADEVWAPSESTAETLKEYGFSGAVLMAPNGTDMRPPSRYQQTMFRMEGQTTAGVGDHEFMFLFVGQHRWEKNVALIIDALAELKARLAEAEKRRPFVAVFVGEGYAADEMRRRCAERGIAGQTRFLGKIVDRSVLMGLYARSDLFLFPSVYDNAPLVMREAAAFSVPTVVAAGSSAAAVVTDRKNGFVTENDPQAMACTLHTIMEKPRLLAQAGKGAVSTIYQSWEEIVDWVVEQYRRIIEHHRS